MAQTISAVQARHKLGDLLNRVSIAKEEFIIERSGTKMAKLIPCMDTEDTKPSQHLQPSGKLDFRTSAGLGKDVWAAVDAGEYVKMEREEWE